MKEMLKSMKSQLLSTIMGQMGNLQQVNAQELGIAVDCLKDISECEYYCSIVEAMENQDKSKEEERRYKMPYYRMYYDNSSNGGGNGSSNSNGGNGSRNYRERDWDWQEERIRLDESREGRSPRSRRMYMEDKELHKDKNVMMKDLEQYMMELSSDITEMIEGASQDEKTLLQKKIAALATKIQ